MNNLQFSNFKIGMKHILSREFSEYEVNEFSKISGDKNPIHLDDDYARDTIFKQRVVHGALVSSIFSSMFANSLPGPGCIYLMSEFRYLKPVFLHEKVTFEIEIKALDSIKRRIVFENKAQSSHGLCIIGSAQLYIP
jgi:3-hydroxybutyryl-CoA dehydratase